MTNKLLSLELAALIAVAIFGQVVILLTGYARPWIVTSAGDDYDIQLPSETFAAKASTV